MRIALFAVVLGGLYLCLFNRTPRGDSCVSSTSANGVYIAELCLLTWSSRDIPEYVGRLYDAKSGKMLVQSVFLTSDPEIRWFKTGDLAFSRGDGGDGSGFVTLPPSSWDKLLAARPRTHRWSVFDQALSKHVIGNWSPRQRFDDYDDTDLGNVRCWDSRTGREEACSLRESSPKQ